MGTIGKHQSGAIQVITLQTDVPISQTDILFDSHVVGEKFEILGIQHFAENITANATYVVKIGTVAACSAATPADLTRADATLVAGATTGSATDAINLHCTTDGSGVFTNLKVRVKIRHYPL